MKPNYKLGPFIQLQSKCNKNEWGKNSSEIQEEQALLNELMDTVTMRKTFEILKSYNWLLDLQDFKSKFNTLWFDLYDRDGDSRKTTLG